MRRSPVFQSCRANHFPLYRLRCTRAAALAVCLFLFFLPWSITARGYQEEAGSHGPRQDQYRTVVDGLNRTVRVPADPRRIVTAGRAVMMTANALWAFDEAPSRVVGVGRISQGRGNILPRLDRQYDRITELAPNVGPEQVVSLNPDLVILKSVVRGTLGEPLERLGIPVIYVDLESPEQYQRDLGVLGAALGEEDRARELQEYYETTAAGIEAVTAAVVPRDRPSTLILYYRGTGGDVAFNVPPAGWMQTRLIEMSGGVPVWREANPGSGWATVSFEQIATWDPQVIILVEYGGAAAEIRDELARQPRWQELQAVRTGRFYAMPTDHYSWDQPDVRWILGLQWTAAILHPALFPEMDPHQVTRHFYRTLYRLDDDSYNQLIAPALAGDLERAGGAGRNP